MVSLIIMNSSMPLPLPAYLCACHPFHYLSFPSFLIFVLIVACVILSLQDDGKEGIGMLEQWQDSMEKEASRLVSNTPPPCHVSYIMEDIYGHCRINAAPHIHM
jgi:hypothetical protein